jgi:hypothetical protein
MVHLSREAETSRVKYKRHEGNAPVRFSERNAEQRSDVMLVFHER